MVCSGGCDNMKNTLMSQCAQSPGPQQEDHSHNQRSPNWQYQTFSPYHVSRHTTNNWFCWTDETASPSWQWEMIWSKEFGRRKPCLSDHLLGLIHVKCESQWPYSAQHTTHTHTQHTHNICTEHTHTQNTHGEHLHSTCTAHTTHTHNLFHRSRVRRGPWSLWAAVTKDHSQGGL